MNDTFFQAVRMHFAFLQKDFEFSNFETYFQNSSATCIASCQSPHRAVELKWGRKDCQFYFSVHRDPVPTENRYGPNQHKWFYIFHLPYLLDPNRTWSRMLDIGGFPDMGTLQKKVALNARVLRILGSEILAGDMWFDSESWEMFREKRGRKPGTK